MLKVLLLVIDIGPYTSLPVFREPSLVGVVCDSSCSPRGDGTPEALQYLQLKIQSLGLL